MLKTILSTVALALTLTACGPLTEITCNGFKSHFLCTMVAGQQEDRLDAIEDRVADHEQRIYDLEQQQIKILKELLATEAATEAELNNLQSQINSAYMQIGELAAEVQDLPYSTVSIIDPCPLVSSTQAKEMLIKVDQRIFAYFEQGNKRFLSELQINVNYQTTDSRACQFTINNM